MRGGRPRSGSVDHYEFKNHRLSPKSRVTEYYEASGHRITEYRPPTASNGFMADHSQAWNNFAEEVTDRSLSLR